MEWEDRFKKTVEITPRTEISEETAEALRFDLQLELRKILRPSVLRELTKPERKTISNFDRGWDYSIASQLVRKIRESNWFVVRRPTGPWHSTSGPSKDGED